MAVKGGEVYYEITAEDKKFKASLKDSQKSLKNFNKNLTDSKKAMQQSTITGKGFVKMLGGVALGFVGIAVGISKFVKEASDAEESMQKFDVTFKGSIQEADKAVDNLRKNYGLARHEAVSLLANTGDLMSGFGMNSDAALNMSEKVNVLAADLASFANVDLKFASEGLTKALFGETEQAKSLGIVIRQNTKEFKEKVKQTMIDQKMTMSQAKATVILEEAYKQSKNAIGDFKRSSMSYANQQKVLNNRMAETRVEIGQRLIPALKLLQQDMMEVDGEDLGTSIGNGISKSIMAIRILMLWFQKMSFKYKEVQMRILQASLSTATKIAKFFKQDKLAKKLEQGWAIATIGAHKYGGAVTSMNKKISATSKAWDDLDKKRTGRDKKSLERLKKKNNAQLAAEAARVKAAKDADKKIEKSSIEHSMTILSTIGQQVGELGNLFAMQTANQTALIDNGQTRQLESIEANYNAEVDAINNSVATQTEKDARLKALDEKRAREEKAINEKADKEKRKLEYDGAKRRKQIAIAETLMTIPQAAFSAFSSLASIPYVGPALGAAAAIAATGLGFAKLALIQQQPLPQLAKGGLITQSQGGSDVTVGEGGSDEAVLPLNDSVFDRMAGALMGALTRQQQGGTLQTAGNLSMGVTVNIGGQSFFQVIENAIENRQIVIDVENLGE